MCNFLDYLWFLNENAQKCKFFWVVCELVQPNFEQYQPSKKGFFEFQWSIFLYYYSFFIQYKYFRISQTTTYLVSGILPSENNLTSNPPMS